MAMPSTDASALPTGARERRWSLAAAIASVTVFGLSVGQAAPLLPLLLEQRGVDVTLNGLNAAATFVGVMVGPLLAPRLVRRFGIRKFLLICFALDIVLFLAMKVLDSIAPGSCCAPMLGMVGSAIFTTSEAWINQLAGDTGRGRIIGVYAAALSAGFGIGPLILSLTGIEGWPPFLVNAAISALATLPLLGAGDTSRGLRSRAQSTGPLSMFARAPIILGDRRGVRTVRGSADGAVADLGRAQRTDRAARGGDPVGGVYRRDRAAAADRLAVGSRVAAGGAPAVRAVGLVGAAADRGGVRPHPRCCSDCCSCGVVSRQGSIRWRSAWRVTGSAAANW